ncbi:MAG TPA: type I methionyl aminopeptidase [Acidobacteriota bacterium]|nr:type I methionyl aminopeptidase [Acidobacteriota bacterium]
MIIRKGKAELEKMRKANLIVASVLDHLGTLVKPGVTTKELDIVAEGMIVDAGGRPAFKGYHGFPASVCTSINDEVVHGIPSQDKVLADGDILAVDVGVCYEGYFGDAAKTFPVGAITSELQKLLDVTRESLLLGIGKVCAGNRVQDISAVIQQHVEASGFSVVREFVGHGIGQSLHEDPQVPNFGVAGKGPRLAEGMVLAIEPMVNSKGPGVRVLADKWTAVTADGGYSAHFEHSVAVTENGPWILSDPS